MGRRSGVMEREQGGEWDLGYVLILYFVFA